jgi:hypothetical protein
MPLKDLDAPGGDGFQEYARGGWETQADGWRDESAWSMGNEEMATKDTKNTKGGRGSVLGLRAVWFCCKWWWCMGLGWKWGEKWGVFAVFGVGEWRFWG